MKCRPSLLTRFLLTAALTLPLLPCAFSGEEQRQTALLDPALLGFGPPGVSAVVTGSQGMDFKGAKGALDLFDGRVSVPAWARDLGQGTLLGAGVAYGWAALDAPAARGLQSQFLQSVEVQLSAVHFPTSDTGWMGIAIVSPGLSSDFRSIGGDDFTLSALVVAGYQFSPRFTLAAAGFYNHAIGEDTAFPGLGIVWRPTSTITVQLTPPIAALGWSPNKNWTCSLTAYPGGGAWAVDRQGGRRNVGAIKLTNWRAGLGVERRFGGHWRLTALAGLNFGGTLELQDDAQRTVFDRDLKPSAFGLLGIALSF